MSDIPYVMDPEEWEKHQAENEMPEEERVEATAKLVEQENQEAPTEEE